MSYKYSKELSNENYTYFSLRKEGLQHNLTCYEINKQQSSLLATKNKKKLKCEFCSLATEMNFRSILKCLILTPSFSGALWENPLWVLWGKGC